MNESVDPIIKKELFLDAKILSSTHLNYLFGAGVNGTGFPQLSGFNKTMDKLKKYVANENLSFEDMINQINDESARADVEKTFKEEFDEKSRFIDDNNPSLTNLRNLLVKTYRLVDASQNRNVDMKQINIFTLNYDNIVETILQKVGYFYNSISASNINEKSNLLNIIGYDYLAQRYMPTYQISKLHGDISNPIIPGKEKYQHALDENFFEIIFNMKALLSRPNSILIVIGYSGQDEHINRILMESIQKGLTVFWYNYSGKDKILKIPDSSAVKSIIVNKDDRSKKDSTEACCEDMTKILES